MDRFIAVKLAGGTEERCKELQIIHADGSVEVRLSHQDEDQTAVVSSRYWEENVRL